MDINIELATAEIARLFPNPNRQNLEDDIRGILMRNKQVDDFEIMQKCPACGSAYPSGSHRCPNCFRVNNTTT